MMIELHNDFHNTYARIRVGQLPETISDARARRVTRELCPPYDCCCHSGPLGTRGKQAGQGKTWNFGWGADCSVTIVAASE